MHMPTRPLLITGLAALIAASAAAATISGTVFEDARALASRSDFRPIGGANVLLFRDGGDRMPDGVDDKLVATTQAAADGTFAFHVADGTYWLAVDSRFSVARDAWAEQTYGP